MISISSTLSQMPRYTNFDATNMVIPNPLLAYLVYNCHINIGPTNSGAAKVQNPNSLETLLRNDLDVSKDGYLHVQWLLGAGTSPYRHEPRGNLGAYVSNGSEAKVNFDNFLVQYQRGKLRQINDYYPYGLTIAGLNSNSDEYLNKYTSKELQTGEFDLSLSTGLEMFDFGSRFYDPQLGVWFTPDPAEQFHNPYLGIGNNPVSYVDPDGEIAWIVPAIGAMTNLVMQWRNADMTGQDFTFLDGVGASVVGGVAATAGAATGGAAFAAVGGAAAGAGGFVAGFVGGAAGAAAAAPIQSFGNNALFGTPLMSLEDYGKTLLTAGLTGGIMNGISADVNGYSFWDGSGVSEVVVQGGNPEMLAANYNSSSQAATNDEYLKLRMEDDFNISEGDFGIKKITTKTGRGFGMDRSGNYINLKSGSTVGGYVRRFSTGTSHMHISPKYALAGDVAFRSVAGHELIHAYHHFTIPNYNRVSSETVAYRYTYDTYMDAGLFSKAFSVRNTALSHGYWGSWPSQYQIPTPFGW